MKTNNQKLARLWVGIALVLLALAAIPLKAADAEKSSSPIAQWWNGPSPTNNLFGLAPTLESYGLTIKGLYKANFYGNVDGGYANHGAFDEELKLTFLYDFEKVFGLKGLTVQSTWRYRDGNDINWWSGAANGFGPSTYQSGKGIRMLPTYAEYVTSNKAITISGGWQNPYDLFLQQPLSKFFMNNSITSGKGIANFGGGAKNPVTGNTASKIPWSSSYASWGGTLKVKPVKSVYIQSGLYLAVPNAAGLVGAQYGPADLYPYSAVPTTYLGQWKKSFQGANSAALNKGKGVAIPQPRNNNGYYFAGAGQGSPGGNPGSNSNGIYSVSEIGWEPKFGKDKLEGKYAFGMIYWGIETTGYLPVTNTVTTTVTKTTTTSAGKTTTTTTVKGAHKGQQYSTADGTFGFYWQADQMLFREHPKDAPKGTLSKQGLYTFNTFTASPSDYSLMDFYFQSGLVYQGLIPGRNEDKIGIAIGLGTFSNSNKDAMQQIQSYAYTTTAKTVVVTAPGAATKITTTNTTVKTSNAAPKAYKPAPTYEGVIEADYQFQINKWSYVQPFIEYIINPTAVGLLNNATVLGIQYGVRF